MIKKVLSIMLIIIMCLTMTDISFADAEQLPALELYLTQNGYEGNSLLASLTDYELAEEEKIRADIYWSWDNKKFFRLDDRENDMWYKLNTKLYRPCLKSTQTPLSLYLNGKVDKFYVKLKIHSSLGTSMFTQAAVLERVKPGENVHMIQMAGPGILPNMFAGTRLNRYAQFHMTVTESDFGYEAVLPKEQPVGITAIPEQKLPYGDILGTLEIPYGVSWEQSTDDPYTYQAVEMWSLINEDYYFVAGNQNFCLKASQLPANPLVHEWMQAFKWYCTVHPVAKGYQTEITLSEDEVSGILSVQMPLKPTGMSRIEIEVSSDAQQTWKNVGIIEFE